MYLPFEDRVELWTCHCRVTTIDYGSWSLLLVWLSDLNAALGLGSSVVIMKAGMVVLPARRRDADPFQMVNNIPEIAYVLGWILILDFCLCGSLSGIFRTRFLSIN